MLTPPIEYRKGAKRVPGRVVDQGRRDTVKAILAPGEAVLNVQAAERSGRGRIAALNREGLRERGEGPPPDDDGTQLGPRAGYV